MGQSTGQSTVPVMTPAAHEAQKVLVIAALLVERPKDDGRRKSG